MERNLIKTTVISAIREATFFVQYQNVINYRALVLHCEMINENTL